MVHLIKLIPHMNLSVKLIRYAKCDFPDASKLYKGYAGVKELDMLDTRRFRTLKSWNFYMKQVQPTSPLSRYLCRHPSPPFPSLDTFRLSLLWCTSSLLSSLS